MWIRILILKKFMKKAIKFIIAAIVIVFVIMVVKDISKNPIQKKESKSAIKNLWLGVDCLNLLGINNVNSYYWVTDVTNQQYAVPNYLTGRQINFKASVEF